MDGLRVNQAHQHSGNSTTAIAFALAIALSAGAQAQGGAGFQQQQANPAQQLFGMGFMMGAMANQMQNPMGGFAQPFGQNPLFGQNPMFGNQFGAQPFGALQGNFGGQQNPSFAAGLGLGMGLALGSQMQNPGNTLLGNQLGGHHHGPGGQCGGPFGGGPFGGGPFGGPPQNPLAAVVNLIMRILQGGGAQGHQGHHHHGQFAQQQGNGAFAFAAAGAF